MTGAELARRESLFSRITWTIRAIGVFWPSVAMVALLFVLCCLTAVGRDIVLIASETPWTLSVVLLAMVFATFTVWYSGRLVGFFFLDTLAHARSISLHLPRFMGFSVFTVLAMTFSLPAIAAVPLWLDAVLAVVFLISYGWYQLLVRTARRYAESHPTAYHARLGSRLVLLGFLVACLASGLSGRPSVTVVCILIVQVFFTMQVGARNAWAPLQDTSYSLLASLLRLRIFRNLFQAAKSRLDEQQVPDDIRPDLFAEVVFFSLFNVLALVALGLFIAADTDLAFACALRPLPIAITGLAIVLGGINLLRLAGRVANVNVLFWAMAFALLLGRYFDAHSVHLAPTRQADVSMVRGRPDFSHAARKWMRARLQLGAGNDSTARIPMVFVLSDGGGARSARWVTHVLARFDSISDGRFREHLFALSGSSGGSVGNITYYGLLRKGIPPESIGVLADRVTGADMLSHTLARMLGNDLLNLLCPALGDTLVRNWRLLDDRAAAVETGLARAGRRVGLEFNAPITRWIDADSIVPLFCINTTRVQDARPAVISSFTLDGDSAFNGRLDVLAGMPPGHTLSVEGSAVLSARFPFVTPGGSIRMRGALDSAGVPVERADLFVDGGYFDNSGAGLVLEMLMELDHDQELRPLFQRFDPIVLHISNGDPRQTDPSRVNSVVNDMLAPLVTIVGAYGEQTDVNNQRLARHLANSRGQWVEVNLFEGRDDEYYPMSWVMSRQPAARMQARVRHHPEVSRWARRMEDW